MTTGMHRDERSVDGYVLCPNDKDRKVSAKSLNMRVTTICKKIKWLQRIALKARIATAADD